MRHFRLTCVLGIVVPSLLLASPVEAQPRYAVKTQGDIVQLVDARDGITVSVLTPVSNAYEMVVKGQDVIRKNFASLDALRATTGLNGIPLLWPYANRLDEQAFYANGNEDSFDTGLGNTGRGAIPIHGYLTNTKEWKLVEAKADADGGVGHLPARVLPESSGHETVSVCARTHHDLPAGGRRAGGANAD